MRRIEWAYWENIRFIYLLEGQRALDRNAIARFQSKILATEAEQDLSGEIFAIPNQIGGVENHHFLHDAMSDDIEA